MSICMPLLDPVFNSRFGAHVEGAIAIQRHVVRYDHVQGRRSLQLGEPLERVDSDICSGPGRASPGVTHQRVAAQQRLNPADRGAPPRHPLGFSISATSPGSQLTHPGLHADWAWWVRGVGESGAGVSGGAFGQGCEHAGTAARSVTPGAVRARARRPGSGGSFLADVHPSPGSALSLALMDVRLALQAAVGNQARRRCLAGE
jgi:hypothetical protein